MDRLLLILIELFVELPIALYHWTCLMFRPGFSEKLRSKLEKATLISHGKSCHVEISSLKNEGLFISVSFKLSGQDDEGDVRSFEFGELSAGYTLKKNLINLQRFIDELESVTRKQSS